MMFREAVRWALGTAILLAMSPTSAPAQYYGGRWGWGGWGGTVQGDIARGMGVYAQGLGRYNVNTAQANAINADTMMRWNSYVWASQHALNQEHYARMLAKRERNKALTDQIAARIRDNPNNGDIERGDALNAILEQLSDPRVHPSALKMARVPLNSKWIQDIPFRYASEAITLSLHRLTGDEYWPVALRGEAFAQERQAYKKAIDDALEQDREGDLTPPTIQAVQDAILRLRRKAEATLPRDSREFTEAENYLKGLAGMARMLHQPDFDRTLAALEDYPGTTVADLLAFMQMFNLRFGPASSARERELYHQLYPLLDRQRDQILQQLAGKVPSPGNPPPPPPGTPPTAIFHGMPWEHVTGKPRAGAAGSSKDDESSKKDQDKK